MTIDLPSFSPCDALVAVMVAVSASDQTYRTSELVAIQRLRRLLQSQGGDRQEQLDMLLKWLKRFPTNEQIIQAASALQVK